MDSRKPFSPTTHSLSEEQNFSLEILGILSETLRPNPDSLGPRRVKWINEQVYNNILEREYLNNETSKVYEQILSDGVEVMLVHGENDLMCPESSLLESLGMLEWKFGSEWRGKEWGELRGAAGRVKQTQNLKVMVLDREGHVPSWGAMGGFVQNEFCRFLGAE